MADAAAPAPTKPGWFAWLKRLFARWRKPQSAA
jgi:hypothetical protein